MILVFTFRMFGEFWAGGGLHEGSPFGVLPHLVEDLRGTLPWVSRVYRAYKFMQFAGIYPGDLEPIWPCYGSMFELVFMV